MEQRDSKTFLEKSLVYNKSLTNECTLCSMWKWSLCDRHHKQCMYVYALIWAMLHWPLHLTDQLLIPNTLHDQARSVLKLRINWCTRLLLHRAEHSKNRRRAWLHPSADHASPLGLTESKGRRLWIFTRALPFLKLFICFWATHCGCLFLVAAVSICLRWFVLQL